MNSGASPSRSLRTVPVRDIKDSARELRQRGSDYRCCIPALAGFVSPQSIAPDGKRIFPQSQHHAIMFCRKKEALTSHDAPVCIHAVKWLALFLLVLLQCSCTTLVNRRDLYSPEPAPDSLEAMRQMTTVTTTTTRMRHEEIAPAGY